MPDSSAGVYTRPPSPLPVTGQDADAPQVNVPIDDMAAALNRRSFRDGRAPMLGNQNFNGYKAVNTANASDPQDYVTLAQMQEAIASVSGLFPGFLQADTVTSTTAPAGWLYANGQEVSRTTYAALWARVQAGNNLAASQAAKTFGQYGPGDGSTTFTLPNLYADGGYFIRPVSSGRGIGTVQSDDLKSHAHTASFSGNEVPHHTHNNLASATGGGAGSYVSSTQLNTPYPATTTSPAGGHTPSGSVTVNATGGSETRPKNIAYPVLIKT